MPEAQRSGKKGIKMLNINKETDGTKLVLSVGGRLDTTTAPELEQEIRENTEGIESLELDLKDLEYISSAGLRVLLSAQKIMNLQGSMVVKNVSQPIMEIFEVTGFSDILAIE